MEKKKRKSFSCTAFLGTVTVAVTRWRLSGFRERETMGLKAAVPSFLAPGTGFVEDSFSTVPGGWG